MRASRVRRFRLTRFPARHQWSLNAASPGTVIPLSNNSAVRFSLSFVHAFAGRLKIRRSPNIADFSRQTKGTGKHDKRSPKHLSHQHYRDILRLYFISSIFSKWTAGKIRSRNYALDEHGARPVRREDV